MGITKNKSIMQPCIKEVVFVTSGTPPTNIPQKPRFSKISILELPPLKHSSLCAKNNTLSGSLSIKNHLNQKFPDSRSFSLERGLNNKPIKKVHFKLPSKDGVDPEIDAKNFFDTTPCVGFSNVNTEKPFSQRPNAKPRTPGASNNKVNLTRRFEKFRKDRLQNYHRDFGERVEVLVTVSPGVRHRIQPTGRYVRGTLSPTSNEAPQEPPSLVSPGGQALLKAARDGDDQLQREQLRRILTVGISEADLNATDSSGRTILSYIASDGTIDLLELLIQVPGLDPNKPDNEGNTPLHFAAQAGQVECLNCLVSRCRGVDIDARNNLGFTPLMKAALQGRNKCAKLLLFAGANPTLRDNGRGFRADQWARFCGRYVCADVIEKHARQRLLERSTSYGCWGLEHDNRAVMTGKVVIVPPVHSPPPNGLKSKLKKVFRTSSGPSSDTFSSARLVTQLTSAALCASSPVLPSSSSVAPMVKSLLRPLTVPRLHITLVNNNGDYPNNNLEQDISGSEKKIENGGAGQVVMSNGTAMTNGKNKMIKLARNKKKK